MSDKDCRFCRTTPNGGEEVCTSLWKARDCPWMCSSDWNALNDVLSTPARPDGEAVAWRVKNDAGYWYVTNNRALAETWRDIEKLHVQPLYAAPPPASAGVREADPLADAWHEIKRASDRNENKEDGGLVLACSMIERRRLRMGLQPIGSIPSALAPSGEKK
jgi:hypothetical protein